MLANGSLLQTRYLIKRLLAQGEMAAFYEAEAAHFDHASVTIKETFSHPRENHEQFQREAAILTKLSHHALPKVHDSFVEGDSRFLVTEFIPGQSLDQLFKEKLKTGATPFHWRQVMDWADRLLDALEYLHSQRPPIFHCDIKPQNLKLTPNGDLFLVNFGLEKGAAVAAKRGRGLLSDKFNYAPPEQLMGTDTDARGDLYSLGATLHHLLSGEMPDSAKVREEVMRYQVPDPLPSAHELNPQVPKPLAELILRSLALDREARYPSAQSMREALRQVSEELPAPPEVLDAERRRQEASRLQWEEPRCLQQETDAREQREAEQRRQEEEKRFLAEQRRREEENRHREGRQRELEQQGTTTLLLSHLKQENRTAAVRLPRVRWVAGTVSVLIVLLVIWLWPQRGNRTASQSLPSVSSQLQPAASALPATPAPEQLQYWFEQFVTGQSQTVATHELAAEREFKLHFKSREDGYLYLLAPDGISGRLTAFLPGGARLIAGQEFVFPNGQRIRGLANGGQLRFTVLLSRNRIENFDALVEQAKSQPEAIKTLQIQLGAISPGNIENFSGRGAPANVVSNQESHQPLIFDINLKFTAN